MKRASFTEEQIIGILRENEASAKAGERARKQGVSGHDLRLEGQVWGMSVSGTRRLRALEDEHGKLKRLLANAMLNKAALNDMLSKW